MLRGLWTSFWFFYGQSVGRKRCDLWIKLSERDLFETILTMCCHVDNRSEGIIKIIASFCKLSRFPPELSLSSNRSTLTVSQLITIANYRLYRIKKFLRCLFRLGWRAYQVALPSSPCDSRSYLKEIQICLRKSSLPPWLSFNSMEVTSLPSPTSQGTKALNEIFIRKSSCFFACALCACFMLLYGAWYIFHGMSSMNLRLEHKETTTLRRKSLATSRALILLSEIAAKKGWNDVHLILQFT